MIFISNVFSGFLVGLIKLYQIALSPWLGKNCRFLPTCSEYAIEVIKSHGIIHGIYLASKRILKCHPFHPGGLDNPPDKM